MILGIVYALMRVCGKLAKFLERYPLYYWLNYLFKSFYSIFATSVHAGSKPSVRGLTPTPEYLCPVHTPPRWTQSLSEKLVTAHDRYRDGPARIGIVSSDIMHICGAPLGQEPHG